MGSYRFKCRYATIRFFLHNCLAQTNENFILGLCLANNTRFGKDRFLYYLTIQKYTGKHKEIIFSFPQGKLLDAVDYSKAVDDHQRRKYILPLVNPRLTKYLPESSYCSNYLHVITCSDTYFKYLIKHTRYLCSNQ